MRRCEQEMSDLTITQLTVSTVSPQDIVFFPSRIKILSPTVGSVSMTEERGEESKQFVVVPDLRNSSLYHQLYIIVGIVTKEQEFEYFQIIISNYCVKLSLSGESVLEVEWYNASVVSTAWSGESSSLGMSRRAVNHWRGGTFTSVRSNKITPATNLPGLETWDQTRLFIR